VVTVTVMFLRGVLWQVLGFVSLVLLGLWAYHFPKIGVEFMPPLNEGTLMDMPVTVPRIGLAQAGDDLKARDALLRSFPEVESVIGKAGRADTPTDPAPLEMVETFVNYRPRELWPKRALKFDDASRQVRRVLAVLEERGTFSRRPMPMTGTPSSTTRPWGASASSTSHATLALALPGVRGELSPVLTLRLARRSAASVPGSSFAGPDEEAVRD
jgi:Cu(I)/Ag(I) efflux system membrane protein CusA/SilA